MLDQTEERFGQEREHYNQVIQDIGEDHYARFRMFLTPDQVPKYEKLHAERVAKGKLERQQQKR